MFVREVADVDGSCAIVGELMGGGAADANWGVCSFDYIRLVGCISPVRVDKPVTMTTLPLTLLESCEIWCCWRKGR